MSARLFCGLCLLVSLVCLAWDTTRRIDHLDALRTAGDIHVAAPAVDRTSETGYAGGQRRLVLPSATIDSDHVVMQAQAMLAGGPWRLRHVSYDNAPSGRDVHWALALRTWLGLLARLRQWTADVPAGIAVEDAALVANPILLALFLLMGVPWAVRAFGRAAGAFLAAACLCIYPFYLNFMAGNAEHQGVAAALGFLTVPPLLGGRSRPGRRGWLVSAIAGGLGLWISAASEAPVLAGVGVGALIAIAFQGSSREEIDSMAPLPPESWRRWGWVGGGISLGAYLLEYFPLHFGWRFEVNHPIYALAWVAGGEALARFATCGAAGGANTGKTRRDRKLAFAALAVVAGVALTIACTRRATFLVSDPFLWRLHNGYIEEFQSIPWYLARHDYSLAATAAVLPLLLPFVALAFGLGPRHEKARIRAQLALALPPAWVASALAAAQIRWWGLAAGLCVAAALPLLSAAAALPARSRLGWRLACALLLVPGAVGAVRLFFSAGKFTAPEIQALAERDLAHWLRAEAGPRAPVVLSTPSLTTDLIFYGGVRGLGTLYWENRAGLRAAAAIFDAPSDDRAAQLIRAAGVTHIVAVSWDPFMGAYIRLNRGLSPDETPAEPYFAACLIGRAPLPRWLRRVPYTLPANPALQRQSVAVFEVIP